MVEYKAIIIDDEELARKFLKSLLMEHPNIKIVGEGGNVPEAKSLIKMHCPDLLFLDIQMPGETGFDLLDQIKFEGHIIFVTAHDSYAIRAFEVNALDYLLKPVLPERLEIALSRLESGQIEIPSIDLKLNYDDRLFILMGSQMVFLEISKILCIQAEGDYSMVHTSDNRKGLISKSMKEWDERLPQSYFCRIHRSSIINLKYVTKIEKEYNYDFSVHMHGMDKPLLMSRRYARVLKSRMG